MILTQLIEKLNKQFGLDFWGDIVGLKEKSSHGIVDVGGKYLMTRKSPVFETFSSIQQNLWLPPYWTDQSISIAEILRRFREIKRSIEIYSESKRLLDRNILLTGFKNESITLALDSLSKALQSNGRVSVIECPGSSVAFVELPMPGNWSWNLLKVRRPQTWFPKYKNTNSCISRLVFACDCHDFVDPEKMEKLKFDLVSILSEAKNQTSFVAAIILNYTQSARLEILKQFQLTTWDEFIYLRVFKSLNIKQQSATSSSKIQGCKVMVCPLPLDAPTFESFLLEQKHEEELKKAAFQKKNKVYIPPKTSRLMWSQESQEGIVNQMFQKFLDPNRAREYYGEYSGGMTLP
jgi:hypothetical protein